MTIEQQTTYLNDKYDDLLEDHLTHNRKLETLAMANHQMIKIIDEFETRVTHINARLDEVKKLVDLLDKIIDGFTPQSTEPTVFN